MNFSEKLQAVALVKQAGALGRIAEKGLDMTPGIGKALLASLERIKAPKTMSLGGEAIPHLPEPSLPQVGHYPAPQDNTLLRQLDPQRHALSDTPLGDYGAPNVPTNPLAEFLAKWREGK